MDNESELIDYIILSMTLGQEDFLSQIAEERKKGLGLRLEVYFVFRVFLGSPERVNWKKLMDQIELLIEDESKGVQCEIVYQNILETFSNAIGNNVFDHKWITPYIGKKSRRYIEMYDEFFGSRTPGF